MPIITPEAVRIAQLFVPRYYARQGVPVARPVIPVRRRPLPAASVRTLYGSLRTPRPL